MVSEPSAGAGRFLHPRRPIPAPASAAPGEAPGLGQLEWESEAEGDSAGQSPRVLHVGPPCQYE